MEPAPVNNSAGNLGGVIYTLDNTVLIIDGTSNFTNNSADSGGAIYTPGNNTILSFSGTSNFTNNSTGN